MLKPAITKALINLLKPLQEEYQASTDWQEITIKAYPPEETKKKEKKVKNRGTKFPGFKGGVEAKTDGHVEGEAKDEVDLGTGAEEVMDKLGLQQENHS